MLLRVTAVCCLCLSTPVAAQWWYNQPDPAPRSISNTIEVAGIQTDKLPPSTAAPLESSTLMEKLTTATVAETKATDAPISTEGATQKTSTTPNASSSSSSSSSESSSTEASTVVEEKVTEVVTTEAPVEESTTAKKLVKAEIRIVTSSAAPSTEASTTEAAPAVTEEMKKINEELTTSIVDSTTPEVTQTSSVASTSTPTETPKEVTSEVASTSLPESTSEAATLPPTATVDTFSKMLKPDLATIYRRLFNLKPFRGARGFQQMAN